MKKVRASYKIPFAILIWIKTFSSRKVGALAGTLLAAVICAHLFDVQIVGSAKVDNALLSLISVFSIAIMAQFVAVFSGYRSGLRISKHRTGLRAYRTWKHIRAARFQGV